MESCEATRRLLARIADGAADADLPVGSRREAGEHVEACAECRAALDEQRAVAEILRARPVLAPSRAFATRVSGRLDDSVGWLGMMNWRNWTFRLTPIAAALALAAFFTGVPGASESPTDTAASSIEAWTRDVPDPATLVPELWQDSASTETILERMVIGADAGSSGGSHVR